MDTDFKDPLLDEVETFLSVSGMSATLFGLQSVNDGSFVANLRDGRQTRHRTAFRARRYMAENAADTTPAALAGTNAATTPSTTPAGESV